MEASALLARFRHETGDDVGPAYLWTDATVYGFLTEAELQACIRSKLLREERQVTLVPADNTVEVLLDEPRVTIIESARLQWPDSDSLCFIPFPQRPINERSSRRRDCTGKPTCFYRQDQTLFLDRIPLEAGVLHLDLYREPAAPIENDGDEPEIPERLQLALVDWALFRAYSRKDSQTYDYERAQNAKARFAGVFGEEPRASAYRGRIEGRRTSTRPRGLME